MFILAASLVTLAAVVGVVVSAFTLPGVWVALCAAVACQVWQPGTFSWWTLGVCAAVAALGEVFEVVSSAVGAKRVGGSRAGGWGALGGALLGAIVGAFFIPPIGTIIGAVGGAGVGAVLSERHIAGRDWDVAAKIGAGAAAGRLVATVVKLGICVGVCLALVVAVWWP
jgi:hypothetical protein